MAPVDERDFQQMSDLTKSHLMRYSVRRAWAAGAVAARQPGTAAATLAIRRANTMTPAVASPVIRRRRLEPWRRRRGER
jgi:hypothetical protein